ncbi:MAG: hypothetical protein ACI4PM_05500 [Butyricicoccus sp.]
MHWKCLGTAALCLLCGCSAVKDPQALADSIQQGYASASVIETDALIQADSGSERTEYKLHIRYEGGDAPHAEVTVLEPESIAGVTAVYDADSGTLTYEDMALETLLPDHDGLTPADAVPALLHSLSTAQPQSVWTEDEYVIAQYREDTEECTIVQEAALSQEDGQLHSARVLCNGTQKISCQFSGFVLQK